MVLLADNTFLAEEIEGKGDSQQSQYGNGDTDDMGTFSLGLFFLDL